MCLLGSSVIAAKSAGRPFPKIARKRFRVPFGGRAAPGPFQCILFLDTRPGPSPGRGHTFVNQDYRGPRGRLGRLDVSACIRVVRTSGRVGNIEKV